MYWICTEDKNRAEIVAILNRHFDAYTLIEGHGAWKGLPEPSLTISIVDADPTIVQEVALEIKAWNDQESVMILDIPCTTTFV